VVVLDEQARTAERVIGAPQLVGSQRVEVGLPTFVTDAPLSELVRASVW
jgi:hypothetical protein